MFSMTTQQSSVQTSDFSSSPSTAIARSAPASILAEPPIRQLERLISFCLSLITISSQGRIALPEGASMPASRIMFSFSIGTGSPL